MLHVLGVSNFQVCQVYELCTNELIILICSKCFLLCSFSDSLINL